jgi:hypothetical protein
MNFLVIAHRSASKKGAPRLEKGAARKSHRRIALALFDPSQNAQPTSAAQTAKPSALHAANGFALSHRCRAWAHAASLGVGPILQERSSIGPARMKYTPRTTVLEATPASYLRITRAIEFGARRPIHTKRMRCLWLHGNARQVFPKFTKREWMLVVDLLMRVDYRLSTLLRGVSDAQRYARAQRTRGAYAHASQSVGIYLFYTAPYR